MLRGEHISGNNAVIRNSSYSQNCHISQKYKSHYRTDASRILADGGRADAGITVPLRVPARLERGSEPFPPQ